MITIKREGRQVFFGYGDKEFRTNQDGEGLWIWAKDMSRSEYDAEAGKYVPVMYWKQLLGTCQFRLDQQTRSGIRKAIERHFADEQ